MFITAERTVSVRFSLRHGVAPHREAVITDFPKGHIYACLNFTAHCDVCGKVFA